MLTRKQHELLVYINRRLADSGVSPSFEEMKDALGLKSKSGIHRLISGLEERGFIRRLPHRARALEVVKLPEESAAKAPRGKFSPTVIKGDSASRVANTSLLIDADGNRVARYDKIHLFDVTIPGRNEQYLESTHVTPGRKVVVADTPVGRLGLSVCYDMRFPELYRELVTQGAEWLAMPAAFTVPTGRAHWETLLRARAIENLCYVVAPAQSGTHTSGRETYGDTLIVDYWGQVLSRLAKGGGVITADIDLEKLAETRARFPALENRRLGLPNVATVLT